MANRRRHSTTAKKREITPEELTAFLREHFPPIPMAIVSPEESKRLQSLVSPEDQQYAADIVRCASKTAHTMLREIQETDGITREGDRNDLFLTAIALSIRMFAWKWGYTPIQMLSHIITEVTALPETMSHNGCQCKMCAAMAAFASEETRQ